MADILLSNDDLTVFGGPESISLDLDIGPQGDRGSIVIAVLGDPRDANVAATIVQDVQALDIAIDYNPFSSTYKTVFQRVAALGGLQWVPVLTLKTDFYSSVKQVTAIDGTITIPPINLTEIYDLSIGDPTPLKFNVQYSISSSETAGPTATNLIIKDLVTTPIFALPLEIKGVEYIDGEWVPMTGPKNVHLFITVV